MAGAAPWFGLAPRPWQTEALPLLLAAVRSVPERRGVLSATMGAGKSRLALALLSEVIPSLSTSECVVVTTPRQFLVRQLWATFAEGLGPLQVGRFYADRKETARPVIVACNASAPALADELARLGRTVALWICDEAHSSQSDGLLLAAEALAPRRRLGCTATPYRSVQRETLTAFDEVVYSYPFSAAIRDGSIVPFRVINWDGGGDRKARDVDGICLDLVRASGALNLGPGLCNARDIEDCEAFSAWLGGQGLRARPIHSRLPEADCYGALESLRRGELDCVVHVNMLSEGVDYPWLRWICLRRRTGARVRFAQELGRALRASPGKTEALVLDPYDLCREFDLATPAAVGLALEREPMPGEPVLDRAEPEVPPAVAVQAVESWARALLSWLQEHGCAEADPSWDPAWRTAPATPKQRAALERMAWAAKLVPQPHRGAIKVACGDSSMRDLLPRGAASDLLSVLYGAARASDPMRSMAKQTGQFWRYRWEWPDADNERWAAVRAPALGKLRVTAHGTAA